MEKNTVDKFIKYVTDMNPNAITIHDKIIIVWYDSWLRNRVKDKQHNVKRKIVKV